MEKMARCGISSSLPYQISQPHFEGGGDAGEGVNRDGFFHALNLADVFGVQIRKLAEPFLGQLRLAAIPAYRLREGFAV